MLCNIKNRIMLRSFWFSKLILLTSSDQMLASGNEAEFSTCFIFWKMLLSKNCISRWTHNANIEHAGPFDEVKQITSIQVLRFTGGVLNCYPTDPLLHHLLALIRKHASLQRLPECRLCKNRSIDHHRYRTSGTIDTQMIEKLSPSVLCWKIPRLANLLSADPKIEINMSPKGGFLRDCASPPSSGARAFVVTGIMCLMS